MNQHQKKVYILDQLHSPNVEQAIIILKDGSRACKDDIVNEAEGIIMNYLNNQSIENQMQKKDKSSSLFFYILVGTAIIVLAYLFSKL